MEGSTNGFCLPEKTEGSINFSRPTKWLARFTSLQNGGIRIWSLFAWEQIFLTHLAFFRFISEMSLGWGSPYMLSKTDQIEACLVKSLKRILFAFKIEFKNSNIFQKEVTNHNKMVSTVHITTKWRDQKMVFVCLTNQLLTDLAFYFWDEPRMRFPPYAVKNWSNWSVFGQELKKNAICFQNRIQQFKYSSKRGDKSQQNG